MGSCVCVLIQRYAALQRATWAYWKVLRRESKPRSALSAKFRLSPSMSINSRALIVSVGAAAAGAKAPPPASPDGTIVGGVGAAVALAARAFRSHMAFASAWFGG